MSENKLKKIADHGTDVLYLSNDYSSESLKSCVFTSPESQSICNDPLVLGLEYTEKLQVACAKAFKLMKEASIFNFKEKEISVLNILRGGLNFELRRALNTAFSFNTHSSIFLSAQRKEKDGKWFITEDSYIKSDLKQNNQLIFGDVVATGTSLKHALKKTFDQCVEKEQNITDIIFFTIGGEKSTSIIKDLYQEYASRLKISNVCIIYLEGIFSVADESTPYKIKIPGTDLINHNSILAPEFIKSKQQNPCYWLERCAIYDAGSRSFNTDEYLEDVIEYWREVEALSSEMTYTELFTERNPGFQQDNDSNLADLASQQVEMLTAIKN